MQTIQDEEIAHQSIDMIDPGTTERDLRRGEIDHMTDQEDIVPFQKITLRMAYHKRNETVLQKKSKSLF